MRKSILKSAVVSVAVALSVQAHAAVIDSGGGQYVWSDLVIGGVTTPQVNGVPGGINSVMSGVNPFADLVGAFNSGDKIHITRLAIAGDSDIAAGDNRFRLVSGGATTDFTWVAGQQTTAADYRVTITNASGDAGPNSRRFAYVDVDYTLAADEGFVVSWDYHIDYDGRYTGDTDILGNVFDDSANISSIRAWVQFEIVSDTPVSEPASAAVVGLSLLAMGAYRRRRRT